ncbi:PRC-barrel domain-containing protein [uncultured Castellaniella sp.]|uniref:PRC-barrel domain-containing protein n=1 Tax=uncultured Castellaniella sp. TaxID=647907 RepID=UPI00261A0B6C|nr:PRC-barrel domain-containing protein [uncultured Castellaniella sp.]
MRAKHTLAAMAVMSMTLAGTGFAQTGSGPASTPAPTASGASGDASAGQQEASQMLASNILGMPVRNGTGDKAQDIGKVTDLVLNQDQKTVNVLIGVGGFLGIGSKDVGVPLDKVEFNTQAKTAVVHMSKEELEKAPAYVTLADKQSKEKEAAQSQSQPAPMGSPAPAGGGGAPAGGGGGAPQ